jgi:outer membrane protein assembly factor BamB
VELLVKHRFACILVLIVTTSTATAENWPSWRGPTSNGISTEQNVPTKWDTSTNVAWKVSLPGPAGSTPVIWDDQIFLTSVDGSKLILMCFGTDGKEQWRQTISTSGDKRVRNDEGNYASPSPVTDGQHVWTMMGDGRLACFTVGGEAVWKLDLQQEFGAFKIQFGMSSTPVLYDDRLYLQLIHGDGNPDTQEAAVIALNKSTGKTVWKVGRITGASRENEHSYSSPLLYNFGGVVYLVTHGAYYTVAYDLKDGSEIWRLGGLNPQNDPKRRYHPTLRFVSSPGLADGIIVSPTAKDGRTFAIRADKKGDLTGNPAAALWTIVGTPDVPSPLIHDGIVYLCNQNGNLRAIDATSGEEYYLARTERTRHRASPVYAAGHIYLTARTGKITVVKAGKKFEKIAVNDLEEDITSSPAISNGTIYLRSFDSLWAIKSK